MSSNDSPGSSFRFVPIVREGFRPKTTDFALDRPKKDDPIEGPLTVPVDLTVEAKEKGGGWTQPKDGTASKDVRMYGPGDVAGIDQQQVVRVEPEPDTADFPPNYFPLVEFDDPSLPWLFSPERTADDQSKRARNRPWITLVVVDRDEVTLNSDDGANLPVLEAPPSELPPPSETWAWAHAQVVGEDDNLGSVVGDQPSRTVSRLLCPRNLHGEEGGNRYLAAVVPTFEPGRLAGLGREPYPDSGAGGNSNGGNGNSNGGGNGNGSNDGQKKDDSHPIEFAWPAEGDEPRPLPVYYMWEFRVGNESRDFESLVDELAPVKLSEKDVGTRKVDASHPGPKSLVANETIDQEGALMAPSLTPEDYPTSKQDEIQKLLNRPEDLAAKSDKPVVGAPIYGQWYPDVDEVQDPPGGVTWLHQLNRDPAYRIGAGMGAEVIRQNQEDYVAESWDQAGQLREMNRVLREGQLARATSNRIHDRLLEDVGPTGENNAARLLQFTQPLHGRVADSEPGLAEVGKSVRKKLQEKVTVPEPVLSPAYRRLTSPRGALARNANLDLQRLNASGGPVAPTSFVEEFLAGRITPESLEADLESRVVTLDEMATSPSQPMMATMEEFDAPLPQFQDVTVDEQVVDPAVTEFHPEGELQGTGLLQDPAVGGGLSMPPDVDVGTEELVPIHRFGNWARTLPDADLDPVDVQTASPADAESFALRKVDAQLQSAMAHAQTAIDALEAVPRQGSGDGQPQAAGEASTPAERQAVEEARRRVEAVKTNTFGPLNRTLDALLSTRTDGVPAAIENDKEGFVQGLLDDHDRAMGAIGPGEDLPGGHDDGHPGADPNTGPDLDVGDGKWIDESVVHVKRLLERLRRFRGTLNLGDRFLDPGDVVLDPEDVPIDPDDVIVDPDDGGGSDLPDSLMGLMDPDVTIPEKVLARLDVGGGGDARADGSGAGLRSRADPLAEVTWAPSIEQPMFEPLTKLSQQYLMPGADDVPEKSIGALATNPAFIESFMVGLNHEFARELLWRRFPTDRRGTYFRTFWNSIGNPMPSSDGPDVEEIHEWSDTDLGGNVGSPNVVVVLRGELLRQFPNTSIYMVRAKWKDGKRIPKLSEAKHVTRENVRKLRNDGNPANDPSGKIEFPIFRGNLDPDVTFLGFDVTPTDAVGGPVPEDADLENMSGSQLPDPGWFVVFEEPMGETRFGLDEGGEADRTSHPMGIEKDGGGTIPEQIDVNEVNQGAEVTWNGLSWNHVVGKSGKPSSVKHLSIWDSRPGNAERKEGKTWRVTRDPGDFDEDLKNVKPDVESSFAVWGRNSAHMARIVFQRPVRMVMHADYLLGAEADASTDWKNATGGGQ